MARDTLKGVRCYTNHEVQLLYLDFGRKYYSFTEKRMESLGKNDISEDELLIGPKVIVEWSE